MKSTWPTRKFCVRDPTQPIFHWLALGFRIGGNTNFSVRVGGNANFSIFRYQHVGIPNSIFFVGGIVQHKPPTREVLRCSGICRLNTLYTNV